MSLGKQVSLSDNIRNHIDVKRLLLANGKQDYITQLRQMLGDDYRVTFLGGGNNPLAKIEDIDTKQAVVLRAVTSYEHALKEGSASDIALQTLQISPRFKKPYFREVASGSEFELISYECSEYYPNGSLEQHFMRLRQDSDENQLMTEIRKHVRHLLFSMSYIRQKGLWHTDIKPSNIMLDDHLDLVFSDNKGLLSWGDPLIRCNRTETTLSYYDDSVFVGNEIDLPRLMQLNIATSIYEMLTGTLAEKQHCDVSQKNLLHFDFSPAIFCKPEGRRMRLLITTLCQEDVFDLKHWVKQLSKPCWEPSIAKQHYTLFGVAQHRKLGAFSHQINNNRVSDEVKPH